MQTSSSVSSGTSTRKLNPQLEILRSTLQQSRGGFLTLLKDAFYGPTDEPLTTKAINANKGRKLYPELQYLCNFLNSGKKLF
jgi:hypothetical protein